MRLYESGLTMDSIAHMLGVGKTTIHRDLADCSTVEQSKPVKARTGAWAPGPRRVTATRPTARAAAVSWRGGHLASRGVAHFDRDATTKSVHVGRRPGEGGRLQRRHLPGAAVRRPDGGGWA